MAHVPLPVNEAARLATLDAYNRETLASDGGLQALVRTASRIADTPIALMSLVEQERQWFPANVGWPGVHETLRDHAFCSYTILGDAVFEVPDAQIDPRFAGNPLVQGAPGIRFYAGMPLRAANGHNIGTLCVIDTTPRQLSEAQRDQLAHLAAAAEGFLTHHKKHAELVEVVDEARLAAERASEAKTTLLHNASHEFNTPLNAVIGFADLIEHEAYGALPDTRYRQCARDIRQSGQTLQRIVADMLDLARLQGRELELRREVFDLREALSSVMADQGRAAENAGVVLICDRPLDSVAVVGDELALRRCLRKVIDNAIKHAPAGSRIEVGLETDRANVAAVCVADQGGGISPSELDQVCGEFQRVGNPLVRADDGAGLGLTVVRQLLEAQGGELWLDSEATTGARFCLGLPRATAPQVLPNRGT